MTQQCACGCGSYLPPKDRQYPNGRIVKNVSIKFLPGHNGRKKNRYIICPITGCWIWQLGTTESGYGTFQKNFGRDLNGKRIIKTIFAYRHYWEQKYGSIPDNLEPDHVCRNRICVNPDHIELVTHAENVRRSPKTLLSVEKVKEAKKLKDSGLTITEIAKMFNVHRTTIGKALSGVNWSDVAYI
jgi:hypothetical protein